MKKLISFGMIFLIVLSTFSVLTLHSKADSLEIFTALKCPSEEFVMLEATSVPKYEDGVFLGYRSYTIAIYFEGDTITGSAIIDDSTGKLLMPSEISYSIVEVPAVIWHYGFDESMYTQSSLGFHEWANLFKEQAGELRNIAWLYLAISLFAAASMGEALIGGGILAEMAAYYYAWGAIGGYAIASALLAQDFADDVRTFLQFNPILSGGLFALADFYDGGGLSKVNMSQTAQEIGEAWLQITPESGSWDAAHKISPDSIFRMFNLYRQGMEVFYHNPVISWFMTAQQKLEVDTTIASIKQVEGSLQTQSEEIAHTAIDIWSKARHLRIIVPTSSDPAKAGDPDDPTAIFISCAGIPMATNPAFKVEIGGKEAICLSVDEIMNPFQIFTLKVFPPTQEGGSGTYDLKVTATFGETDIIETEENAVEYTPSPPSEPIEMGLTWLRTSQYSDGSWRGIVGVTALCALAFLNAGYDETDTTVSKAINYILSKVHSDGSIYTFYSVYETSTAMLALTATHNANYATIIENAKNWLVGAQQDETFGYTPTNYQYGGWTYWSGSGDPDLSNTQFALLALDAANLPKTDPTWSKAVTFTQRCQNRPASNDQAWAHYSTRPSYNDGGFIYRPWGWSLAGGTTSYGSMTGAGIWGLLLSGVPKTDERVVAAMNWVTNHYTWDNNPGIGWWRPYYYYLSMSKALTMYGEPVINGHDWYQELYNKIVGMQIDAGSGKGYWSTSAEDYNPDLTTAYAILSLQTRGVAPPVQRLSYLTFILRSNCLIRILDSEGNLVGYNYMTRMGENQIPTAVYSGLFSEPQYIVIITPKAGTYQLELVGISEGTYELTIQGNYGEEVTDTFEYTGYIKPAELHGSDVTVTAIVGPLDIYTGPPEFEEIIDNIPPTTTLEIGEPKCVDPMDNIYVTSTTPFTLTAEDNPGGTGVASIIYRIYNSTYDTGWLEYSAPFDLTGLSDSEYSIDYYSTDTIGNTEATNTAAVILDNAGPLITVSNPPAGWALQDGVTFMGSIVDSGSGVFSMSFSIREADGGDGVPIGFEDLPTSHDPSTGEWSLSFDTLLVPDGYYVLHIEADDNLGNEASKTIPYSIRNWAVIELLPSSEDNKAGRTMPVKFALRVAAEVDPSQPFVYNEELRIEIYATNNPAEILQESYFGDTSRDYRLSSVIYITNFRTLRTTMEYTVAIYRDSFDIGSFTFETTK